MQRRTTLMIAAMTVSSALVGFLVAGSALAADWHEYQGKVHPGHAYLIPVPAGADALELGIFDAAENSTATAALFSPSDERVGFYELSSEWPTMKVQDVVEGGYVLYVYDLMGANLGVRVLADDAGELELFKVPTHRFDQMIAEANEPSSLKEMVTLKMPATPVFAALLYQGSVTDLDATISTEVGDVVVIEDESGTAYGPGLWGRQTGTRAFHAENLAPGRATAKVAAESFEGEMWFSTLHYDRSKIVRAPATAPDAPEKDAATPEEIAVPEMPQGTALEARTPTAILVPEDEDGLYVFFGHAAKKAAAEGEEYEYDARGGRALVSVFDTRDNLVEVLLLEGNEPGFVSTPMGGEYVLFVWSASRGAEPMVALASGAAPEARTFDVVTLFEESYDTGYLLGPGEDITFTLDQAPLALGLIAEGDTMSAFETTEFVSENGIAARQDRYFTTGGFDWFGGGVYYEHENLVEGDYVVQSQALAKTGTYRVVALGYERLPMDFAEELPEPEELKEAPADEEADASEGTDEEQAEETAAEEGEESDEEQAEEPEQPEKPEEPTKSGLGGLLQAIGVPN